MYNSISQRIAKKWYNAKNVGISYYKFICADFIDMTTRIEYN